MFFFIIYCSLKYFSTSLLLQLIFFFYILYNSIDNGSKQMIMIQNVGNVKKIIYETFLSKTYKRIY